jgi:catechol 2,3-dioxygenase-like lactoylglutathione lyase family enzyme
MIRTDQREPIMLKDKTSTAMVAVSDLDRARDFYANKLGLELGREDIDGVLGFKTGDTWLTVYRSENVRAGSGNAVGWSAGDEVEAIADELRTNGVTLEEYPELGLAIDHGVHRDDTDFRAIWFKDPDGNILHVNSM